MQNIEEGGFNSVLDLSHKTRALTLAGFRVSHAASGAKLSGTDWNRSIAPVLLVQRNLMFLHLNFISSITK